MKIIPNKTIIIVSLILLAIISRLLPHLPNFTPIMAIALFGGTLLRPKWLSVIIPLITMFISDYLLSLGSTYPFFHSTMGLVYLSMIATISIGWLISNYLNVKNIFIATLVSSLLFFIVTNLGSFAFDNLYPKTFAGLIACYTAAIPFFRNELFGNFVYTTLLFGAYFWYQKQALAKEKA